MSDTEPLTPLIRPLASGVSLDPRYDIVVVGGGITGVGCALDAALRGQKTLLVEARDIAAGTSSKSSKLVHGGIRYLEQLDFGLVRESLHEQKLLQERLAPHLVRPLRFLMPGTSWLKMLYVRLGTLLYDLLGRRAKGARAGLLGRRRLRRLFGSVASSMKGAVAYQDAQMDDVRLAIAVAKTAAEAGATIVTHASLRDAAKDSNQKTWTLEITDVSAKRRSVEASQIILAGGVWNQNLAAVFGGTDLKVQPAKGAHILVPRERIEAQQAIVTKTATSVLFILPAPHAWILGTTDSAYQGDLDAIVATEAEQDYILAEANKVLEIPLTRADIMGAFAGVRPLVSGADGNTARISRQHVVRRTEGGAVMVSGGKYTTYRAMAEDAVDMAVPKGSPACATEEAVLWGATATINKDRDALVRRYPDLHPSTVASLVSRYGHRAGQMLRSMAQYDGYLTPVTAEISDHIWAELYFGVAVEGAYDLEDLLHRRLRLDLALKDAGLGLANQVEARLVELGLWPEDTRRQQRFESGVKNIRPSGQQ